MSRCGRTSHRRNERKTTHRTHKRSRAFLFLVAVGRRSHLEWSVGRREKTRETPSSRSFLFLFYLLLWLSRTRSSHPQSGIPGNPSLSILFAIKVVIMTRTRMSSKRPRSTEMNETETFSLDEFCRCHGRRGGRERKDRSRT